MIPSLGRHPITNSGNIKHVARLATDSIRLAFFVSTQPASVATATYLCSGFPQPQPPKRTPRLTLQFPAGTHFPSKLINWRFERFIRARFPEPAPSCRQKDIPMADPNQNGHQNNGLAPPPSHLQARPRRNAQGRSHHGRRMNVEQARIAEEAGAISVIGARARPRHDPRRRRRRPHGQAPGPSSRS